MYSLNEGNPNKLSLKCSSDKFKEMIEINGVIPAPYLARNNWICLQQSNRMRTSEIKELIKDSYNLVFNALPKKIKNEIK